jgi:hypothetical protein
MKRFLTFLVIAASWTASAQDGSGVIKTNPFGWFAGQYQFGYEHFISEKASVQLMPGGIFGSVSLTSTTVDSTFAFESVSATRGGFIVIPEFRYYLGGEAPDGMYISAFGRFRSVKTTLDDDGASSQTRSAVGGGFVLGYQYMIASGLTGELFLGPQFKATRTTSTGQYDDYGFAIDDESDTGIRFGLNIGFGL